MELPGVCQHTGSHAEGHVVGEGVVFHAELAGGAGKPCHFAVTAVEDGTDHNGPCGHIELPLESQDDAEKAAE